MELTFKVVVQSPINDLVLHEVAVWLSALETGKMPSNSAPPESAPTAQQQASDASWEEFRRQQTDNDQSVSERDESAQAVQSGDTGLAAQPDIVSPRAARKPRTPKNIPAAPAVAQQPRPELEPAPVAATQISAPAVPPGMRTPPPVAVTTAISPAMPPQQELPFAANGVMTIDQLRSEVDLLIPHKPSMPFNTLRAATWRDGSTKESWFTLENVPEALRTRLLAEMHAAMASPTP